MKKIALLAMLCVFSIVGVQSAQAVEGDSVDLKNRPQFERKQDFQKFENNKQTDKEFKKHQKEMKKDHEQWQKEKKKNWEKRQKVKEKNRKQWEKKHKKYGSPDRPNWEHNKKHKPQYGGPRHHKYDGKGKHQYGKKSPHRPGMHHKAYGPHKGNHSKPQPKTYPAKKHYQR